MGLISQMHAGIGCHRVQNTFSCLLANFSVPLIRLLVLFLSPSLPPSPSGRERIRSAGNNLRLLVATDHSRRSSEDTMITKC